MSFLWFVRASHGSIANLDKLISGSCVLSTLELNRFYRVIIHFYHTKIDKSQAQTELGSDAELREG